MKLVNSNGKIFYGMHFYPGVAEYSEEGKDPFRIFINENTIRKMNPTFAGRPVFVEHVDEVDESLDELRGQADGWVVESFYNSADGKTWVKFIVVSERGLRAIKNGFRLSNTYIPETFGPGGLWNGVQYVKEVTGGYHEHMAIVRNPRYEESQILTPDEFKTYNEGKELELKRLANSKDERGASKMKGLNLFKRTKVENSADLEGMSVTLPKSGVEKTITQLVNEADAAEAIKGKPQMANAEDEFMVGEQKMTVAALAAKLAECESELAKLKQAGDKVVDVETMDNEEDEGEDSVENEEDEVDEEAEKAKAAASEKKKNEADKIAADKAAKEAHFKKLKNARETASDEVAPVELMQDQVARGKTRYGS
jgi:hypothetical protein